MGRLSTRHETFCYLTVGGMPAELAAIRAGFGAKTVKRTVAKLLKQPAVVGLIEKLESEQRPAFSLVGHADSNAALIAECRRQIEHPDSTLKERGEAVRVLDKALERQERQTPEQEADLPELMAFLKDRGLPSLGDEGRKP